MNRKVLLLAALPLLPCALVAQPMDAPMAPDTVAMMTRPAISNGPATELKRGMGQLLEFLMSEQNRDPDSVEGFLHQQIAPYFDFSYMAMSAAGPYYQQMSVEQRQRMAVIIEQQFLSTLAEKLAGYTDQQVRVMHERVNPDQRTGRVTVAVMNPRGYPARLDFRFYKAGEQWRVFDVMANGNSAVLFYRDQFRNRMLPQL